MADKKIVFDILARDRASDAFKSAGRSADQLGEKTSRMGTAVKAALVAGVAAAGAFAVQLGKASIDAAKESMKVAAQTDAVIKSTAGVANVSAEAIGKYSHQLQLMSGVSDETIQSGANMLLTFTNIRNEVGAGNDVFNQATATLLDMSVATGQDMSSAAVTMGKALNDPIAGISALTRVGVQFTQAQKDQIAQMVQAGDTMGAQKVILAELTTQFGGSAAAQGNAMTAGERLSMRWGDMQEQLGMWLIPKINALIGAAMASAEWIDRNRAVVVPLVAVLGSFAAAVVAVTTAARIYTAVQGALNVVLAANPVGLVVVAVAALAAGLVVAYQRSETFRNIVNGAFAAVRTAVIAYISPARAAIGGLVDIIERAISAARRLASAVSNLPGAGVVGEIISRIPGFADGVTNFSGGVALVGERGPELVHLPRGSDVIPNHQINGSGRSEALLERAVELLSLVVSEQRRGVDMQVRLARTY